MNMNTDIKNQIEILQAYASGEPIEKRTEDRGWEPVQENHLFDFLHNEYRIKPKYWRAELGQTYSYITSEYSVVITNETNTSVDDNRYDVGNYFATREEALEVADIIKIYLSKCHTKNEN